MTNADPMAASGQANVGMHTQRHSLPSKAGVRAPANSPKIEPRRSNIIELIQPLGSKKSLFEFDFGEIGGQAELTKHHLLPDRVKAAWRKRVQLGL